MHKMRDYMCQFYSEMKLEMGMNDNYGVNEDQPPLDQVLEQLKTNTDPANFIQFMKKKDNIGKDSRNRAIARKYQKQQEDAAFRNTDLAKQFTQAGGIRHNKHKKIANREVDQILNAVEVINKEAIQCGLGGDLHGPASKMLSGVNMLRAKGPLALISDPQEVKDMASKAQTTRYLSNYKAGLIRHNIVARTDLMKMYQPPIKKSQLPNKDPF